MVNEIKEKNGTESEDEYIPMEDLKRLAEAGDPEAQYELAKRYREGKYVQKNYEEAVRWYGLSAEQGNFDAQYNLGAMYRYGYGVGQDYELAVEWYRKAAEQGGASVQYNDGHLHHSHRGIAASGI